MRMAYQLGHLVDQINLQHLAILACHQAHQMTIRRLMLGSTKKILYGVAGLVHS